MSIYGNWILANIGITNTSSAEVDLGRDYEFLQIQIPTITSATIKLQTADKTGGTFKDLGRGVTTPAGTHNYHDVFKLGGYRFIKIVSSVTQAANRLIEVRGMRN